MSAQALEVLDKSLYLLWVHQFVGTGLLGRCQFALLQAAPLEDLLEAGRFEQNECIELLE